MIGTSPKKLDYSSLQSMTGIAVEALIEWEKILDSGHVVTEESCLREAETATFSVSRRIPAILRPATREQVQECLQVANHYRIPLYPISSGKNWGYGSRVPSADSCVLLDLSRMNRITDFSEDLAYVTVEPGVTQRQLFRFLQERKSNLWMDATGSSPDCSLIGNTMERGFGHTPYGDHFSYVCGLEVVLPTGELAQTGFSRFEKMDAAPLYRWGVGPSLDGLFSQSNLGIVTRMTIWLMPAPEHFEAFFFRCDEKDDIGPLIEALRPLRLNGTLRSTVHIGNDYKVLSALQQYPWEQTAGHSPLTFEQMREFRKRLSMGSWNGSGGLYGTRAQVAESKRLIRKALAGKVKKLQFLNDRTIELASRFAKPFRWITGWDLKHALDLVRPVYGLMKGIPTDHSLTSSYWRKRTPIPAEMNPDRDGCGLLWCAPVAPATREHALELTNLVNETLLKHGFEPIISLSLITERALTCVVSISYDRHVEGEDAKAMRCLRDLLKRLTDAGYYSYRLGIQSMEEMNVANSYNDLLRSIRETLDPNGILAPGRYEAKKMSRAAAAGD